MQKLVKFLLVAIIAVFLLSCSGNNEEKISQLTDNARLLVAKKQYETALMEYGKVIEIDHKNETALFEMAETHVLLGRIHQAVKYYKFAAQVNPENIVPKLRLAQVYLQTGQLLEARTLVTNALEEFPDSIKAYHLLSGIQIQERDLKSAILTLQKAVLIDDTNLKTHLSLGGLYVKINDIKAAESAFQTAMENHPSSREAYMGLVQLYAVEKEWDKVETILLSVSETKGIQSEKFRDLARFYEAQNKLDQAEEFYQKAMLTAAGKEEFTLDLAEFYARIHSLDKAVLTLQSSLNRQNKKLIKSGLSEIYYAFGEFKKAESIVDEILEMDSDYPVALIQKGKILIKQKKYKDALDIFDRVILLDKFNSRAYFYRAICIRNSGASDRPEQKVFRAAAGMLDDPIEFEKKQIKENLLAAIAIAPDLVPARLALAKYFISQDQILKAKEQINEILKYRHPRVEVMNLIAAVNLAEGRTGEAEKILRAILKNKPDDELAKIRLGLLYKETGQTDKAFTLLKSVLNQAGEDNIGIARIIVEMLIADGKYDSVLTFLKNYKEKAPLVVHADIETLKGDFFYAQNKYEEALAYYYKAAELNPVNIKALAKAAAILKKQNKIETSLEKYLQIEKLDPDFLPALTAIAYIYEYKKDISSAEMYYRKILEMDPDRPAVCNNLAFILSERKDTLEEALLLSRKARAAQPRDPDIMDTMGWVYYQKGSYLSAKSELEESLKINPENALANYHYGMVLYKMKEFEKARDHIKKALKIDPGFKDSVKAKKMLN